MKKMASLSAALTLNKMAKELVKSAGPYVPPTATAAAAAPSLMSRIGSNMRGAGKLLTKTPGGRILAALGLAVPAATYGIGAMRGRMTGAADAVDAGMGAYGEYYNQPGIMSALRRMVLPDQKQIAGLMAGRLPEGVRNRSQFFKGAAAHNLPDTPPSRLGAYGSTAPMLALSGLSLPMSAKTALMGLLATGASGGIYAGKKSQNTTKGFAAGAAVPTAAVAGGVGGGYLGLVLAALLSKKMPKGLSGEAALRFSMGQGMKDLGRGVQYGLTGAGAGAMVGAGETAHALSKK